MKIFYETNLMSFDFWSGARDFADKLTAEQFETIEQELKAQHPDGMDQTKLNNLFWFEQDYLKKMLGVAWPVLVNVETHLGSHINVSVNNEYELNELLETCNDEDLECREIGSAFENPDEEVDVEWNDFDIPNILWEQGYDRYLRQATVPVNWPTIIESNDFTGVGDEEEAAIREFMNTELADPDEVHIWCLQDTVSEELDYGGDTEDKYGDGVIVRFYKKE